MFGKPRVLATRWSVSVRACETYRRNATHDFLATVYRFLGIDPDQEYPDLLGRPVPLTRGTPIEELV